MQVNTIVCEDIKEIAIEVSGWLCWRARPQRRCGCCGGLRGDSVENVGFRFGCCLHGTEVIPVNEPMWYGGHNNGLGAGIGVNLGDSARVCMWRGVMVRERVGDSDRSEATSVGEGFLNVLVVEEEGE